MFKKILFSIYILASCSLAAQIDLINDNIGIGLLNPTVPIQLKGDIYKFQNESGTDLFHMNSSGNIGIGKAPSGHKLDVQGNIFVRDGNAYFKGGYSRLSTNDAGTFYLRNNNSALTSFTLYDKESTYHGSLYGSGNGANFGLLDGNGQWSYLASKNNYVQLRVSNVPELTVAPYGMAVRTSRVHIGAGQTGNRYAYLDLQGDDTYTTYSLRLMRYGSGPNATSQLAHRGTGPLQIYNVEAGNLEFITNSTHRIFIRGNDGNVGVGTTNPAQKLTVNGSIQYSGSLINASDKRLKKNVNDFKYGIKEVMKLNPVSFQYKDIVSDMSGQTSVGLIAQELNKVAPDLVKTFKEPQRDKIDEDKEKSLTEYLGIEENAIKYMLINAIKEQQAQLDEQRKMIEELQSSITVGSFESEIENAIEVALANSADNLQPYISQNIPNPTESEALIKYFLPQSTNSAVVRFYNLNGQVLREVNLKDRGQGVIDLNIDELVSGSYLYSLMVDGQLIETKTMVITK